MNKETPTQLRTCFCELISEIHLACRYLDQAATAFIGGDKSSAIDLIRMADVPVIWDWAYSIMGESNECNRSYYDPTAPTRLVRGKNGRAASRSLELEIHKRDGYQCVFCRMPLITRKVRDRMLSLFPEAIRWGTTDRSKHNMIRIMQAQYDHVLPYSRGGETSLSNLVLTCHPCNYGRGDRTLGEVGLIDPRGREVPRVDWDGLQRLL